MEIKPLGRRLDTIEGKTHRLPVGRSVPRRRDLADPEAAASASRARASSDHDAFGSMHSDEEC
jgi:hypothetical protein